MILDYSVKANPILGSFNQWDWASSEIQFCGRRISLEKPQVSRISIPESHISLQSDEFPETYGHKLSPQGNFLLVYRKSRTLYWTISSSYVRLLEIFEDTNYRTAGPPRFEYVSYIVYSQTPAPTPTSENDYENSVIFHPNLPKLAFCRQNQTVIWNFNSTGMYTST